MSSTDPPLGHELALSSHSRVCSPARARTRRRYGARQLPSRSVIRGRCSLLQIMAREQFKCCTYLTRHPQELHTNTCHSRGRKIFHRFDDVDANSPHISKTLSQRALRHAAGAAANRLMTRSHIQPRLLFPVSAEEAETDIDDDNIEDETDVEVRANEDVEMSEAPPSEDDRKYAIPATPAKGKGRAKPLMLETPPTTGRATRMKQVGDGMAAGSALTYDNSNNVPANTPNSKRTKRFALVEIAGDDGDDELDNHNDGLMRPPPTPARNGGAPLTSVPEHEELPSSSTGRKSSTLFDLWPRTKNGGRKRDGESMASSITKRTTRSAKNDDEAFA